MKNILVKKTVRAVFTALELSLCLSVPALSWAAGSGTTGAEFLKIGVGARALAMGGAAVALTDDAHAYYWNPAGAAMVDAPRVDATYNNLYQGTNQGFVGYAHPLSHGVLGLSVDYLQVSDIEHRNGDTANADYTFASKDSSFGVSYSEKGLIPGLALGATLKYLQSYLDNASAHAIAGDFGALYRKDESSPLSVGISLVNVGTDLKYINAHEPLPTGVHVGSAYRLFDNKLIGAVQYDDWFHNQRSFGDFGLEYRPHPIVGLRVGYQAGRGADQLGAIVGFSAGVGIQFKRFNFDYAYLPYGDLGSTQRFSFGLRFGDGADHDETMKSAL